MHSIFAKAGVDPDDLDPEGVDLSLLGHELERDLLQRLADFPELLQRAAEHRAPHLLCDWLEQLAGAVNAWYHAGNPSRNPELAVLTPDSDLRAARLLLSRGVQIVLRNGLTVLGVTAPQRMEREPDVSAPGSSPD
jgi:arginyl-tRNA synthetase